jgi:glycosyl transferase, family 25
MNRIYSRFLYELKLVIRLNLIVVKNLLRGNISTKKYVLYFWLKENLSFFFPLNDIKMYFKVKKIRKFRRNSEKIPNSPAPDLSKIIKMVYINLDNRRDRYDHMESELKRIGLHSFKRFSAIKRNNGALGCALSHLGVLKEWDTNKYPYILVCEDDIRFEVDIRELFELINNFIFDSSLDILCLGNVAQNKYSYNNYFKISNNIQTTSCYLVKKTMKVPLINSINTSIKLLENEIDHQIAAIDITWKSLQNKFNFAIPNNIALIQIESFSDIRNSLVNYH